MCATSVLIVLNSFECDGPGLSVLGVCQGVVSSGKSVKIRVCAISRDGDLRGRFEALGIKTFFFPARSLKGILAFRNWLGALAESEPEVPFVIHSHLLWPDLLMRLLRGSIPRAKLVSTNHGLHAAGEKGKLKALMYGFLEKITRGKTDLFLAVSKDLARQMVSAGYPRAKVLVVPNGVDCERFRPYPAEERRTCRKQFGIGESQPMLLAVGNFRAVKNHERLIEAMVLVKSMIPEVVLFLVGNGELGRRYRLMIEGRNLSRTVRLVRPMFTGLPLLMSSADVLVHPSRTESFGLVVAESLACGTPVIATRAGALPELVLEGKTGLLVEKEGILALSRVIVELLIHPDQGKKMGRAGREHVVQNYSNERSAENMMQIWRKLVSDRL